MLKWLNRFKRKKAVAHDEHDVATMSEYQRKFSGEVAELAQLLEERGFIDPEERARMEHPQGPEDIAKTAQILEDIGRS